MKCNICSSDHLKVKYRLYDDRYGYPGNFPIFFCSDCGHGMLDYNPDDRELEELYTNYYPRSKDHHEKVSAVEEMDNKFSAWLSGEKSKAFRWVPGNVTVLDIGCGYGETLEYHQSRGCNAYGVDIDENIAKINHSEKIKVGPFDPGDYEKEFFDYVTLDQVLEHVQNPILFLRDVKSILKPGGLIIIATPNPGGWGSKFFGKKWIHWHIPYHCQFFTKKSLKFAADECDLNIIKQATITPSIWLHLQWMHLLFYPGITQPSVFWGNHLISVQEKQKTQTPRSMKEKLIGFLWRRKINDMVTRAWDLAGFGDNHLCILQKKIQH